MRVYFFVNFHWLHCQNVILFLLNYLSLACCCFIGFVLHSIGPKLWRHHVQFGVQVSLHEGRQCCCQLINLPRFLFKLFTLEARTRDFESSGEGLHFRVRIYREVRWKYCLKLSVPEFAKNFLRVFHVNCHTNVDVDMFFLTLRFQCGKNWITTRGQKETDHNINTLKINNTGLTLSHSQNH